MTELEMQTTCYKRLKSINVYKEVVLEVPFLSRCIDMVLITNDNKIISVEFKLRQWREAIQQACDHKLGADESYICLPKRRVTNKLMKELQIHGIGLFLYNPNIENPLELVVPAKHSTERWNPMVTNFKQTINQILNKKVI